MFHSQVIHSQVLQFCNKIVNLFKKTKVVSEITSPEAAVSPTARPEAAVSPTVSPEAAVSPTASLASEPESVKHFIFTSLCI